MKSNKVDNKISISFFILLVFFMAGFFLLNNSSQEVKISDVKHVNIKGVVLDVELAITPEDQSQGLSSRVGLAESHGMLFVFNQSGKYGFWMKDMNFPIDMIWIAGGVTDARVVYIQKNATPESYPKIFGDEVNADYVLEVVSGFSEKNNLQVGDTVEFLR